MDERDTFGLMFNSNFNGQCSIAVSEFASKKKMKSRQTAMAKTLPNHEVVKVVRS